ncbi:MAG: hypothetical protein ACSHXJ_12275 [Marinomonas colpomeniae]
MKYAIGILAIGTDPEINIDENEFNDFKQAKLCLSSALAIEEKYELLLSNYLDLEKECLNVTSDYMVRRSPNYSGFFDIRLAFNRRVVNLLTSTKLYIDQIQQHVRACIPEKLDVADDVKALFSTEYDTFFEYRFMDALRNYVQHRGLAVHFASFDKRWTSDDIENGELEYKVRIYTHKIEVASDSAFKRKISEEMPDKVDLIHAIRVYVGSISKIHCEIREWISDVSEKSRVKISNAINEYQTIRGKKPIGLNAIKSIPMSPADEVIDKVPLLLDWDDIRLDLIKMNKNLSNLNKCYVTNSTGN